MFVREPLYIMCAYGYVMKEEGMRVRHARGAEVVVFSLLGFMLDAYVVMYGTAYILFISGIVYAIMLSNVFRGFSLAFKYRYDEGIMYAAVVFETILAFMGLYVARLLGWWSVLGVLLTYALLYFVVEPLVVILLSVWFARRSCGSIFEGLIAGLEAVQYLLLFTFVPWLIVLRPSAYTTVLSVC